MEEPHLFLSFTLYISPLTLTIYFTISPPIFISHINIVPNYLGVSQWMR